jgi:hypothetical protein
LHATPEAAIENLEGKIWTTNISPAELPDYQDRHTVLSSAYNRDNSLRIRVLTETAMPEFRVVSATLEDVYFAALRSNQDSGLRGQN